MKSYTYPAMFTKDGNGYSVSFPDLDGCITEGETVEMSYSYAKEALSLYLDGAQDMPSPTPVDQIINKDVAYIMLVDYNKATDIIHFDVSSKEIFQQALKAKGLTKYKFAKLSGLSESYINRIASGERRPSPDIAKKIEEILGLDWTIFYN